MPFGKELKRLRAAANISVAELSSVWGISAHKIRKWEERDSEPQKSDQKIIEKVYGKTFDQLISLEQLPKVEEVETNYLRESGDATYTKDELISTLKKTIESLTKTIESKDIIIAYQQKEIDLLMKEKSNKK